jgi:two-component system nitrogen regulation sensor histidine kinase NtrY
MPFNLFRKSKKRKVVFVTVKEVENNVMISVKDNGIGIAKTTENKFLNQNSLPKQAEWDLGLGIIKNIIENYKGTITFETEFGKGTTFIVSLPD